DEFQEVSELLPLPDFDGSPDLEWMRHQGLKVRRLIWRGDDPEQAIYLCLPRLLQNTEIEVAILPEFAEVVVGVNIRRCCGSNHDVSAGGL
ncbi:MAG: hypothetical protein HRJ53_02235, partial [Acidobacteria bacterium Pan2503]|nr:hypothetical protein [Candidatus Acidoferrum panamensis]